MKEDFKVQQHPHWCHVGTASYVSCSGDTSSSILFFDIDFVATAPMWLIITVCILSLDTMKNFCWAGYSWNLFKTLATYLHSVAPFKLSPISLIISEMKCRVIWMWCSYPWYFLVGSPFMTVRQDGPWHFDIPNANTENISVNTIGQFLLFQSLSKGEF